MSDLPSRQRIRDDMIVDMYLHGELLTKDEAMRYAYDHLLDQGIEADAWESRPAETDDTYYITILADEPLDAWTMHGRVVLLPAAALGITDE